MIYSIDNGNEIKLPIHTRIRMRNIRIGKWMEYMKEYHHEKGRAQADRVSFGHYGEWFTPDILSGKFNWEKI